MGHTYRANALDKRVPMEHRHSFIHSVIARRHAFIAANVVAICAHVAWAMCAPRSCSPRIHIFQTPTSTKSTNIQRIQQLI